MGGGGGGGGSIIFEEGVSGCPSLCWSFYPSNIRDITSHGIFHSLQIIDIDLMVFLPVSSSKMLAEYK